MDDKNRIRAFVQNNQMSEAKTLCVEVCEKNPDDAESWFLHGMLNGMLKDFSGSTICYDNVIRLMPEMAAAYYNKGVALQGLGKHDKALAAFEKVSELEPNFENIDMIIADTLTALNNFELAASYYKKVLDADASNIHASCKYGSLLIKQEKYQDAERVFREATSLKPDYAEAYFGVASSLQLQNNLEEAKTFYIKAIELRPDYSLAYNNLGIVHKETDKHEEAVSCFSQAVHYKADYADAYSNLGHAYQMLKKYRDALAAYQKANELNPGRPEINYSIGLQYESLGRFNDARNCFTHAALLDPNSNRYPFVLARVYAAEKNYDKAIEHYKESIEKDATFADAYNYLGRVYMDMGDSNSALESFRKAHEINPDHVTVNYYLADLDPDFNKAEAQSRYVADLFDHYADTFETDLVDNLQYKTPAVLHEQVMRSVGASKDLVVYDLGCGTGLCGALFRDVASRLVGVDLSSKIVEKAREKSIYDELQVDELTAALIKETNSVDLILAADVYVYIGDLKPIFDAAASALRPNGLYAFSVEHNDGDLYELQSSGRFSHSVTYINALAASANFQVLSHKKSVLRKEFGSDVQGDVYVLGLLAGH